jgi:chromatin segregation and condensation protein Rec8/ScpA/Scc1 (kleisin family)
MLFEDLLALGHSKQRVIATYLALLELAKIQAVRLYQNCGERGEPLGPIRARLALSETDDRDEEERE